MTFSSSSSRLGRGFPFLRLLHARRASLEPDTTDRRRPPHDRARRAGRVWVAIGCAMLAAGGLTMRADVTDAKTDGAPRLHTPSRSTTIALTGNERRVVVVNREANSVSVIEVRARAPEGHFVDVVKKLAEIPTPTTARRTSPTASAAPSPSSACGTCVW
jgi:hypothetical protein